MARNSRKSALYDLFHPFEAAARRRERDRQARARREREEQRARASREYAGRKAENQTHRELEKLTWRGCYYIFSDLPTLHAGNIDHLVVGPEGLTIVETKANSGAVEAHEVGGGKVVITVGGKELHRDLIKQLRSQMWDLCKRAGLRTGPDDTHGMNWIVCFPSGTEGCSLTQEARMHIANTDDLLMKLRAPQQRMDDQMVQAVASAVSRIYERPPSASPARRPPHTGHEGREPEK